MDNTGKATRRMPPPPHPLTQQNYYLCDVTNHVPDIPLSSSLPPTTPHYRDLCHHSYTRSIACIAISTTCPRDLSQTCPQTRYGPVLYSSQSIESRSHYRSPNNHVLCSVGGVQEPMRTRETNIIRDGCESIRDRRRRLRTILLGPRPHRARALS